MRKWLRSGCEKSVDAMSIVMLAPSIYLQVSVLSLTNETLTRSVIVSYLMPQSMVRCGVELYLMRSMSMRLNREALPTKSVLSTSLMRWLVLWLMAMPLLSSNTRRMLRSGLSWKM